MRWRSTTDWKAYNLAHVPRPVYQPPENASKMSSSEARDASPPEWIARGESSNTGEPVRQSPIVESSNIVSQAGTADSRPRSTGSKLMRKFNPFK